MADDDLFVKDGEPVKFCFHRSVRQGRSHIRRDVEVCFVPIHLILCSRGVETRRPDRR